MRPAELLRRHFGLALSAPAPASQAIDARESRASDMIPYSRMLDDFLRLPLEFSITQSFFFNSLATDEEASAFRPG